MSGRETTSLPAPGRSAARSGVSVMPLERSLPDPMSRAKAAALRVVVYGLLLLWTFICLFPIYWTVTTSFKTAASVTQGFLVPYWDFQPASLGWRSLGLSSDTIFQVSTACPFWAMP